MIVKVLRDQFKTLDKKIDCNGYLHDIWQEDVVLHHLADGWLEGVGDTANRSSDFDSSIKAREKIGTERNVQSRQISR
jgi:hypothetical protein